MLCYGFEDGFLYPDWTLHCDFPPYLNMGQTHWRTKPVERTLRERVVNLEHVVIHAEPRDDPESENKELQP